MKSLSLSTPLVRTIMSKGGSPAVYMWFVSISDVMVSGSGNLVVFDALGVEGESGWLSVADDDTESSTPSRAGDGGKEGVSSIEGRLDLARPLDLMVFDILVWEKDCILGGGGAR